MMLAFLYLLVVIVAGRTVVLLGRSGLGTLLPIVLLQLILSLAVGTCSMRGAWQPFAIVIAAMLPLLMPPDKRARDWVILMSIFLAATWAAVAANHGGWFIRPAATDLADRVQSWLVFWPDVCPADWTRPMAKALGFLSCISEAGVAVGLFLRVLDIEPDETDKEDFMRSSLIGSMERALLFVFAVYQAFNAAAFVLTAKGVIRFYETKKRKTAEYVLVGTLVSTLIAILIGLLADRVAQ